MASLQHDDAVRYLVRRRAGRAALLALALAAACGGDGTGPPARIRRARLRRRTTPLRAARDRYGRAGRSGQRALGGGLVALLRPRPPSRPGRAAREAPRHRHQAGGRADAEARRRARARRGHERRFEAPADADGRGAAPSAAQDSAKIAAENAGTSLRDAYHQAPRDTVSQAVYDGWKQFNLNCARCHGEDVLGTTIAPHLIVSLKPDGPINTKELFVQTVCAGRPEKGMPAWCALGLGMDKINEIYEYVKGRSDAKISPGRPAVKQQG